MFYRQHLGNRICILYKSPNKIILLEHFPKQFKKKLHKHSNNETFYILFGDCRITHENEEKKLYPFSSILVKPEIYHGIDTDDKEMICISILEGNNKEEIKQFYHNILQNNI